jgi:hypothetical protein
MCPHQQHLAGNREPEKAMPRPPEQSETKKPGAPVFVPQKKIVEQKHRLTAFLKKRKH